MGYLKHEVEYRQMVNRLLSREIDPDVFVDQFMESWKRDRDDQWAVINSGNTLSAEEDALSKILGHMFVACDCYVAEPVDSWEIGPDQLRSEIAELAKKRWNTKSV